MSDSPRDKLPPKKEVALALLEGESVFIHLDPRREGVLVPKQFVKQTQLVLQVGLKLAIRIPDLHIDDEGISCTLSFNRAPFWCRMPWGSIYALVGPDGRGMLWPDDVPPEVAAQMRAGRGKSAAKRPRPRLSAVRSDADDTRPDDPPSRPSLDPDARTRAETGEIDAPDSSAEGRVMRRPRPRAVPSPVPSLAAVPNPPRDPRRPSLVPSPREDDPPPRGAHVKAPPRAPAPRTTGTQLGSGSGDAGKRPKRELPPYLRVVK
jgi:stringent starvation protein B